MSVTIENTNHKARNPKFSKLHIKAEDSVIITYSWSNTSHGICGHNFEAYELLKILKSKNLGSVKYLIPDDDRVAQNIKEALSSKYESFNEEKDNIINGKPVALTAKTVILCDGCLPTKGIINANKLIMILCGNDPWWIKNIKTFTGDKLELWYDDRLGYPITKIVHEMQQIRPDMNIKCLGKYKKTVNFGLYKSQPVNPLKPLTQTINEDQIIFMAYVTGNCRDLYNADRKHNSDTLKEIKDIINNYPNPSNKTKTLLMVGWNPTYTLEEKMYYQQHKDQRIFEDRKRASITAMDFSDYFDIETTIVPECDLPIDNIINEFDIYIYTPTERNWDCSSRLIPECKFFGKELILTPTTKRLLDENLGLKYRIIDYYPEALPKEIINE